MLHLTFIIVLSSYLNIGRGAETESMLNYASTDNLASLDASSAPIDSMIDGKYNPVDGEYVLTVNTNVAKLYIDLGSVKHIYTAFVQTGEATDGIDRSQ